MLPRYHSYTQQAARSEPNKPKQPLKPSVSTDKMNIKKRAQQSLMRAGVSTLLARKLTSAADRYEGYDEDVLAQCLAQHVAFTGVMNKASHRVLALVGPTGVGKTTTIAKLAAQAALVKRWSVALVSIDYYRYGATDQLEKYADLIGVPIELAFDPSTLRDALARLSGVDLVLVDTAGRSPRDGEALSQLAECLRSPGLGSVDVRLCLSATAREEELEYCVRNFNVLRPTSLVVTKVDEAALPANLVVAPTLSGLPLSLITTGQRVPEDIEVASAELMAKRMMEGANEWYDLL